MIFRNMIQQYLLVKARELTLDAFISRIFPIKATQGEGLKILTSKQMLQRLPIALKQVKACNTSENYRLNQANHMFFVLRKRNY